MGRIPALGITAATLIVLGATPPAAAGTLTLAHVLDVVRAQSPAVHAARARAEAAREVPAQARAYDDPTVSWETWNVPESLAIDRADNNILRVSQKIPFPGKRTLAGEMASRDAVAMAHDADATELDALAYAKRAYADLWRAHRNRAVYQRQVALAERIARLVENRYSTGDASQPDVLRAEIELSHAVTDVRTTELAVEDARAALAAVMSEPSSAVVGDPADPPAAVLPPSPAPLLEEALRSRPEVGARDAAVARAETGLRLAEKGYLPDFELSVGRFLNANVPNGFGGMVSMTVPLAWKSKYDAGVQEARARIVAVEAERRLVADTIRREVEQAYLRARTADVLHELFGSTHIPHAEQALRVTEAAYVAGTTDLTAVVEAARAIESVHLEHIAATADFERAHADLERAVGHDLPRSRTVDGGAS